MVEGQGVANCAASALVTARLSSPTQTRSRTSRARLVRNLGGIGEGLRGHENDSVGEGEPW